MIIAVPSEAPGGLDAPISAHFGHCHAFTMVNVESSKIGVVNVLDNEGHAHGGCMAPVMLLHSHHVEALVAGGMGGRPLAGFQQVGIRVYFKEEARSVRDAVQLLIDGKCREFGSAQACGGGGGGCGGEHEQQAN
jgi:predicted Fe-Mo cluster-binding NifX family protein